MGKYNKYIKYKFSDNSNFGIYIVEKIMYNNINHIMEKDHKTIK